MRKPVPLFRSRRSHATALTIRYHRYQSGHIPDPHPVIIGSDLELNQVGSNPFTMCDMRLELAIGIGWNQAILADRDQFDWIGPIRINSIQTKVIRLGLIWTDLLESIFFYIFWILIDLSLFKRLSFLMLSKSTNILIYASCFQQWYLHEDNYPLFMRWEHSHQFGISSECQYIWHMIIIKYILIWKHLAIYRP